MGEDKKEKKSKKKKEKTEDKTDDAGGDAKEDQPKRAQRATSNVFALFNQQQIQEFKEAFTMMDQDRDGIINEDDLGNIYQQVGREPDPKLLKDMIAESPGQLNFTHFLTLFGEKTAGRDPDSKMLQTMLKEAPGALNFTLFLSLFGDKLKGTDPESRLRDAFTMFDPEKTGKMDEEYIKDLLMNVGDPFSKDEIKQVWKEAPIEGGKLDYMKFVAIIKRGKDED